MCDHGYRLIARNDPATTDWINHTNVTKTSAADVRLVTLYTAER